MDVPWVPELVAFRGDECGGMDGGDDDSQFYSSIETRESKVLFPHRRNISIDYP